MNPITINQNAENDTMDLEMRKCLPLITSIFVTLVLCAATTGNFAAAESPTVVPLWPAWALGF